MCWAVGETLLLSARTPTVLTICAHSPSMVWTSHHPLGLCGSWVPASSASSTQSLIGTTIVLASPWPAEALSYERASAGQGEANTIVVPIKLCVELADEAGTQDPHRPSGWWDVQTMEGECAQIVSTVGVLAESKRVSPTAQHITILPSPCLTPAAVLGNIPHPHLNPDP